MQTLILFLSLLLFGHISEASIYAQVPELYVYYSTYQMEFYAYGAGNTNMGKSCKGTGTSPCTLLQFLQEVMLRQHQTDFKKGFSKLSTADQAILNTQDPDVTEADRVLHTTWTDWTVYNQKTKIVAPSSFFKGSYDGSRLKAGYDTDISPKFNDFLKSIADDIQTTRQEVRDGLALVSNVDTWVNRATLGLLTAHGHRIADQSEGLVTALTDLLGGDTVKTKPTTLPNGRVYSQIDSAATMAASGIVPGSAAETQWLAEWASWTKQGETTQGFSSEKKASIRHQKLLNTYSTMMSRLLSTPDC